MYSCTEIIYDITKLLMVYINMQYTQPENASSTLVISK